MKVKRISPLAPASFPVLPPVRGVRLAATSAGIRYSGCDDLMLAVLDPGTTAAAVLTSSLCPAAPVDWCRHAMERNDGKARALICNTGSANAFTGAAGYAVTTRTAESVAAALATPAGEVAATEVLVASTGVIAEPLKIELIENALPRLLGELCEPLPDVWEAASKAIGTTDTFAKGAAAPVEGTDAHVVGFAKGSGMIAPDMATMLAFIFTDLAVDAPTAQKCLQASTKTSFNRITVDSDTSTSDMAILFSTGASGIQAAGHEDTDQKHKDAAELAKRGTAGAGGGESPQRLPVAEFQNALDAVTLELAQQIVRDGEGATKFVSVTVVGATDDDAAAIIARAIADSPLVKTALAASDANWGRIVAAVGKAGQKADRDRLSIWIGDEQCAEAGMTKPGYSEERATSHLKGSDVELRVDVGVGRGEATVWTCDLTHAYIDINANYRT